MKSRIGLVLLYTVFSALNAQNKIEHKLSTGELSQFRHVASRKFSGCHAATDVNGLNVDLVKLIKADKCKVHGYIREKGFLSARCSNSPLSHVLGEGEHIITYAKSEAKCWELLSGLQSLTYDPYQHDLIARTKVIEAESESNKKAVENTKQNQTQIFYAGFDFRAVGGYAEAPKLYAKNLNGGTYGGEINAHLYLSFTRPGSDFAGFGIILGGRYVQTTLETDLMSFNSGGYIGIRKKHSLPHFDIYAAPGLVFGGMESVFNIGFYYTPFLAAGSETITTTLVAPAFGSSLKDSVSSTSKDFLEYMTKAFSVEMNIGGRPKHLAGSIKNFGVRISFSMWTIGNMQAYVGSLGMVMMW
jgi:hypothetical protein